MGYNGITSISTTANIYTDVECAELLNKYPEYLKKELVELKGNFGTKYFIFENGTWVKTEEY